MQKAEDLKSCYLHYGCGFDAPAEWLNVDASPILYCRQQGLLNLLVIKLLRRKNPFPKNVRYGNILSGLKKYQGRCRAVYCSHVLEHLTLDEFRTALKNTYELLHDGGVFRLVVPSLETLARKYVSATENKDPEAARVFCRDSYMGREKHGSLFREMLKIGYFKNYHLWAWDYYSLEKELRQAGFRDVREARQGDSPDPMFGLVENPERFRDAVAVECTK